MTDTSFDYQGLTAINIVRKWLETHKCVNARQLAVETDGYYSESAFRMTIWRMAHSGELEPTDSEGLYVRGQGLKPAKLAINHDEIGMLALFMPIQEVARLYDGISEVTVQRCKALYLAKNSNLDCKASTKRNSKLTVKEVETIREDYFTPKAVLAARYGISYTSVWNIQHGRSYVNLSSHTSRPLSSQL